MTTNTKQQAYEAGIKLALYDAGLAKMSGALDTYLNKRPEDSIGTAVARNIPSNLAGIGAGVGLGYGVHKGMGHLMGSGLGERLMGKIKNRKLKAALMAGGLIGLPAVAGLAGGGATSHAVNKALGGPGIV